MVDNISETENNLIDIYHRLVQSEEIIRDPNQEIIIQHLHELSELIKHTKDRGRSLIEKIYNLYSHQNLGDGNIQGVYLYGGVGRGKSMIMDLFYDNIDVRRKRRTHFHSFMLNIHDRLNEINKSDDDKDPIEIIINDIAEESWLLCFDELQVTDIADAMILGRLFKGLFEKNVVVVATSNRHPDHLYKNGLQREQFLPFIEIFKEKLDILTLDGEIDYRLQQIKSLSTTYFVSKKEKDRKKFIEESFFNLIGNNKARSCILTIQGRDLEIDRIFGDTAIFDFKELCEQPLGSADYIEISQKFSNVLIGNIPILTAEKRNEAKRFVNLIDELYEHGTKLICSAEAKPENLYKKGDYSFEFERTSSRLIEMQSMEYLEK